VQEGRASTTARLVTAARLRSPREHVDGGRPDDDERLARDVAGDLVDRPTMLERHLIARTRFVDRVVVRALDDGIPQVVLAGAGYDGRALRYARPASAGSISTTPTPSGTSAPAWPGWASPHPASVSRCCPRSRRTRPTRC
jgi:hypothetical protein